MPSSPAARTVRRKASTPRRWPSTRGSPRAAAQRPLPSMMMATWRGGSKRAPCGIRCRVCSCDLAARSNRHDLFFFGGEHLVDFRDGRVGSFLHVAGMARVIVFADLWSFSSFFRRSRASRRTWRTATRAVSAYLCATLTISLRRSSLSSGMRSLKHLAFGRWGQAEIGGRDCLLDRMNH